MNRRGFLKMLGIGAAVAAVSPTLAITKTTGVRAAVGEYADYASFSSFSIAQAIDPVVALTAAELGCRAAEDINSLYAQQFG